MNTSIIFHEMKNECQQNGTLQECQELFMAVSCFGEIIKYCKELGIVMYILDWDEVGYKIQCLGEEAKLKDLIYTCGISECIWR